MKKILVFFGFVIFAMVNVVVLSTNDGESKQTLNALVKKVYASSEREPDLDKACPNSSTKTCVVSSDGNVYEVEDKYSS